MKNALEIATRIGERLCSQAEWHDDRCGWQVRRLDRSQPGTFHRSIHEPCGGTLYQGSSGIALFLAELFGETGDPRFAHTARGAMRHALAAADELPPASFGLYGGRVGIAWTAARLAERLERPELARSALGLLQPLHGLEARDTGLDRIAGAAGAIPALLDLEQRLGPTAGPGPREMLRKMATALGERLLTTALREPCGWSWATGGPSAVRHLTGLAHGVAGIGLALLELAAATGDGRFRFAAEMAFLYERGFFDPEASNWPDLRHSQIGDRLVFDQLDRLRTEARTGAVAPYEKKFMVAWCHGSPGIALSRLRAFELTGQARHAEEARAALRSTRADLAAPLPDASSPGASLCHGILGNCEVLLAGAAALGDPTSRRFAERLARELAEHYELAGRPWPCGTPNGDSDPSLLVGEAGIGHFYLRRARADVPSILLLQPAIEPAPLDPAGFADAGRTEILYWLGNTWRALEPLGEAPPSPPVLDPAKPLESPPAEGAFAWLRDRLATGDDKGTRLRDASAPERLRYELSLALDDFTGPYLQALLRPEPEALDWQTVRLGLAAESRLRSTSWNGETWNGDERADGAYWLVHRAGRRFLHRRIGPLAAAVLQRLETPGTLAELVAGLRGSAALRSSGLAEAVRSQVEQLYRVGALDVLPDAPATPRNGGR